MGRTAVLMTVPIQVQVAGEGAPQIAEYGEQRVRSVLGYVYELVLTARVWVTRHGDPAVAGLVTA